ncbi:hypothetical protein TNCV_4474131 [Trichonephila clavipes]|nr:hypothetical protein TNCV_4474131 [Trichonephila clavipes]
MMGSLIPNVLQPGAFISFEETQGPLMKVLLEPGWWSRKQLAVHVHFLRCGGILDDCSVKGILSLVSVPNKIKTTDIELSITVTDDKPIYHSPRRLPFTERDIVDKQIDEWIQNGVIEPCSSAYASQVLVVRKKDGSPRVCIDFRKLNRVLVKDHYLRPLIEDILDKLQDTRVFSAIDLRHIIENNKLFPSPSKTKSVVNYPEPKTTKEVQRFLGLTGYFRKFIPAYSVIAKPLSDLLRKDTPFNFDSGKQEGFLHPLVKDDIPLNTYHIDHLGPLATSSKNYKFILAVIDSFTKFVWLYPTKTTSTSEVIKKLDIQKTTFGNPRFLITGRGTTFTSDEFHTYCSEQKITLHHITTGLPRANGQVERINRTIIPVLSKMSEDDPTKWFKHVPSLQEVLNSTFQRSINTTPFELLFGT